MIEDKEIEIFFDIIIPLKKILSFLPKKLPYDLFITFYLLISYIHLS
jgi:hypothetical protein